MRKHAEKIKPGIIANKLFQRIAELEEDALVKLKKFMLL